MTVHPSARHVCGNHAHHHDDINEPWMQAINNRLSSFCYTNMSSSALLSRTLYSSSHRILCLPLHYSPALQGLRLTPSPTEHILGRRRFSSTRNLAMATKSHFLDTSGEADSVWIHTEPYSNRPQFKPLAQDIRTDACVIGSGIAGVSTSYELVQRGVKVVMLEARDILSGESGRSSHP